MSQYNLNMGLDWDKAHREFAYHNIRVFFKMLYRLQLYSESTYTKLEDLIRDSYYAGR